MENECRELTVKYLITEEQYQKLCRITELYRERGTESTPESWFDALMNMGSKWDIDDKLRHMEKCLEATRDQNTVLAKTVKSVNGGKGGGDET